MNETIFEFDENGCSSSTPSIGDAFQLYFKTPVGAAFFCMAFVSTFSTLAIYLYAMYKIRQHNPVGTERRRALTLVFGLFPVFAISSLFGIVIPRATYTVDWAASIYLAITLYSFFGLIMEYFGGAEAMIKYFDVHPVSFAQAPYACCCRCLPDVRLTESQFHFVRYLVLQVTFIRPFCVFLGAVLWSDAVQQNSAIKDPNAINFWLGIISGFSTGFAVYGLQIFSKSSQEYLEKYYVKTKFVAVQLVLILTGLVRLVMDILGFTESITCRGPLRSPERGQIIYNHVTIHIMATCIIGFFVYWIWLSRFSSRRNEVEHPVEVPESPTSTAQPSDMDDKAEETKEV